jgi:hypothetical protein
MQLVRPVRIHLEVNMSESQQNAPYRAIGALIYAGVSALWVIIVFFNSVTQAAILALATFLIAPLIVGAVFTLHQTVQIQPISSSSPGLGKWFGMIFSAEGIGIGVGSGILIALNLNGWIAPWVALLVGLHFFPLGRLLNLPLDYGLGAAIVILVVLTVLAVEMENWPSLLGLGAALLLWLAGWGRLLTARQVIRMSRET